VFENIVNIVSAVVTHQDDLLLDVFVFLRIRSCCKSLVLTAQWRVMIHASHTLCLAPFVTIELLL
jgi:hypothetical protein